MLEATALTGGMMVYFINENNTTSGRAFGFSSDSAVSGRVVTLPNGSYRVYAYGWDGGQPLQGQTRCGRGDQGAVINLSGVTTTVSLDMSMANCLFGTENDFGLQYQANDPSPLDNFDEMSVQLCTGDPFSSCNVATSGSYYMKLEMLGGSKFGDGAFSEDSSYTLSSGCAASGTGTIVTAYRPPVGTTRFSPPMRLSFYPDATCSSASGTYTYLDGIKQYRTGASGTNQYLDLQSSSSSFYFRVLQNF